MKGLAFILLFLSSLVYSQYPSENIKGNVDPRPVDLYKAFKLYKKGDNGQTINVMEELGFNLDRTFKRRIEPSGQADSLIFKIDEKAIAIFHTVDLIYLKNVDVTITFKTDQNIKLLVEFKDLLEKEGLKIKPIQCDKGFCYRFEENDEFWIVDKRWKEWTYTKWQSLYRYFILAHEDFLMVSLTETIPKEWVPRDKVPRDKVYR